MLSPLQLIVRRAFCASTSRCGGYLFLFPGQGSQYVGMTKQVSHLPEVQNMYNVASAVLGFDARSLCLNGPQARLDETIYCQPTVVLASLAAVEQLKSKSPEIIAGCKAAAGFSVGELSALIFAGSLTLEEGLHVVNARAKAMQLACKEYPGGMLSVIGMQEDALQQLCSGAEREGHGTICIANYIFPKGFVLAGTLSSLQFVRGKLESNHDVALKEVAVSGAFHSPLMGPAVQLLRDALAKVKVAMPRIPVYSNVTGRQYKSLDEIERNLCRQVTHPVLWNLSIGKMLVEHPDARFVEVGPGRQLRAMLRRISPMAFKYSSSFDV